MSEQTDHIRRLNDMTRTQPKIVNASWDLTHGVTHLLVGDLAPGQPVAAHAPERVAALRTALASFRDWESGNDPYGGA
jgi:hypothetical protein